MSNNFKGNSLSKLISSKQSKPLDTLKIHGSFQQLYELLSKQTVALTQISKPKYSKCDT